MECGKVVGDFCNVVAGGALGGLLASGIMWKLTRPKPDIIILRYREKQLGVSADGYWDPTDDTITFEFFITVMLVNEGDKATTLTDVDVSFGDKLDVPKNDEKLDIGLRPDGERNLVQANRAFKVPYEKAMKFHESFLGKEIPCKLTLNFVKHKSMETTIKLKNLLENGINEARARKEKE